MAERTPMLPQLQAIYDRALADKRRQDEGGKDRPQASSRPADQGATPPQNEGEQLRAGLTGIPVFKPEIPFLVAYKKASAAGTTVNELKSDRNARRAWISYRSIGEEILND